jgi:hypothetical protein
VWFGQLQGTTLAVDAQSLRMVHLQHNDQHSFFRQRGVPQGICIAGETLNVFLKSERRVGVKEVDTVLDLLASSGSEHGDSHSIIPHLPLHGVRTIGRRNRLPCIAAETPPLSGGPQENTPGLTRKAGAVGRPVTVDEGIAPSASAAAPCVNVSLHTAPQTCGACHAHRRRSRAVFFTWP